jgi:hypothetical protein
MRGHASQHLSGGIDSRAGEGSRDDAKRRLSKIAKEGGSQVEYFNLVQQGKEGPGRLSALLIRTDFMSGWMGTPVRKSRLHRVADRLLD